MRFRAFAATVLVVASFAGAQEQGKELELSLENALELSVQTSEQISMAQAGLSRAEADHVRARSQFLPQVNGSISYERTLASEFAGLFSGGGGGTPGFLQNLPFGRENIWRYGVSASAPLFAGGRIIAGYRQSGLARDAAELGLVSARAQATLEVAQGYYDAVLADRLLAIAESSLKQAEQTLEHARLGRKVGTVPEFELLRAEVTHQNQRPIVLQRRMERGVSFQRLRQLLDVAPDVTLRLTTSLETEKLAEIAPRAAQIAGVAAQNMRATVRQAEQAVSIREEAVTVAWAGHLPSLTASTQYGRVSYPEDLFPGLNEFRTNWTAGLFLQIPLFSGGRAHGDVRAARADLVDARSRLQQTEELSRLEEVTATEQLEAAAATFEASAGAVMQARRAYEIAEVRYREGISTQLELSDARLMLQQAEATRARAARDLQVARIRLALLPALPLFQGGAVPMTVGAAAGSTQRAGGAAGAQPGAGRSP